MNVVCFLMAVEIERLIAENNLLKSEMAINDKNESDRKLY